MINRVHFECFELVPIAENCFLAIRRGFGGLPLPVSPIHQCGFPAISLPSLAVSDWQEQYRLRVLALPERVAVRVHGDHETRALASCHGGLPGLSRQRVCVPSKVSGFHADGRRHECRPCGSLGHAIPLRFAARAATIPPARQAPRCSHSTLHTACASTY